MNLLISLIYSKHHIALHTCTQLLAISQNKVNVGEAAGRAKPFCRAGRNVNWYTHCGKQHSSSSEDLKPERSYDQAIPFHMMELNWYVEELTAAQACCSMIHDSSDTIQVLVDRGMNEQKLYFNLAIKGNAAICDNTYERRASIRWSQPETGEHRTHHIAQLHGGPRNADFTERVERRLPGA